MIDPTKITNYDLDEYRLQEMILFWVLVAGKTAKTTVRLLDKMLNELHEMYAIEDFSPFDVIRMYDEDHPGQLESFLKKTGFGCQATKARAIRELIKNDFDLSVCTVKDLEGVYGIGPKTARCFVMHTRPNARHAGLDTHLLKWLKSMGHNVPASTPSKKRYEELELVFLGYADKFNKSPAELDLEIWNQYSRS